MPRFVIERFFDRISDDDILAATVRSESGATCIAQPGQGAMGVHMLNACDA